MNSERFILLAVLTVVMVQFQLTSTGFGASGGKRKAAPPTDTTELQETKPETVQVLGLNFSIPVQVALFSPDLSRRASEAALEQLQAVTAKGGVFVEDVGAWSLVEKAKGKVDFDTFISRARKAQEHSLRYQLFIWVDKFPAWALDSSQFVAQRCLLHDEARNVPSLFSPATLTIYERLLSELARQMEGCLGGVTLGLPNEEGLVGYPDEGKAAKVTKASADFLQDRSTRCVWCGDDSAKDNFRRFVRVRYPSAALLNLAWNVSVTDLASIPMPVVEGNPKRMLIGVSPLNTTAERRRWLDFVDWYERRPVQFCHSLLKIARRWLLDIPIHFRAQVAADSSIGFPYRITRLVRTLGSHPHASVRLVQRDLEWLTLKLATTACHFYRVPFTLEFAAGESNPSWRGFLTASTGSHALFEFFDSLTRDAKEWTKLLPALDGSRPVTDVALVYPTTQLVLDADSRRHKRLSDLATRLRDVMDADVIDEFLIQDGALEEYRVVGIALAHTFERDTLETLKDWVRRGGLLTVWDDGALESIEGLTETDQTLLLALRTVVADIERLVEWRLNATRSVPYPYGFSDRFFSAFYQIASRRIGQGTVVFIPRGEEWQDVFVEVFKDMVYNRSARAPKSVRVVTSYLTPATPSWVCEADGVWTARVGKGWMLYDTAKRSLNMRRDNE